METQERPSEVSQPEFEKGLRFYAGIAALILAMILPVFVIAIPYMGIPIEWKIFLGAGFFVGGPDLLILVALALLGRKTLAYFMIKAKKTILWWKK